MLRKRKNKDLRTLDPNDPEYWEEILRRENLTLDAGRNIKKLFYVGGPRDVADIEEKIAGGRDDH